MWNKPILYFGACKRYLSVSLQFDFVKLLDGKQLIKQEVQSPEFPISSPRHLILASLQETGFVEYMDAGTWHLAFYNDGRKMEQVFVHSTAIGNCRL